MDQSGGTSGVGGTEVSLHEEEWNDTVAEDGEFTFLFVQRCNRAAASGVGGK